MIYLQNTVKKLSTIILAVVCVIIGLTNNQKSFCQEYDELKIFLELPDSLLKFEADFTGLHFNQEVRAKLFQEPFLNDTISSFIVDSDELFGVEKVDNLEYIETSQYDVVINKDINWINMNFYGEYYWTSLDFVLIPQVDSYIIVLLKQYEEEFGMASVKEISSYYFDAKNNKYVKRDISFPELDWTDFYKAEDVSELNMNYLDGVSPSYSIDFFNIDKIITVSLCVDLDDVTRKFLGTMDHFFIEGPNQWDDHSMTYDSLGFYQLTEANKLYFTYPNFQLLAESEFELAYLYNSFSEKYAKDLDIDFTLRDNQKAEETLFWNEQYSIDFIDTAIIISFEMMNKLETKAFCIKNGGKEYFVVCSNSNGFVSESKLIVFEKEQLSLKNELSLNLRKNIGNEDFGIDYSENVFEKHPDIFSLRYEADQSALKIILIINPPIENTEVEEIIKQIEGKSLVLEFQWSEIIK